MAAECIFCRIARGEMEAKYLHQDADVVAIQDINPGAPVHALVIPRQHFGNVSELRDAALLARLFEVAHEMAAAHGVSESGYRLVFNVGADAGQSVDHVHLHVLGGRHLAWPPG